VSNDKWSLGTAQEAERQRRSSVVLDISDATRAKQTQAERDSAATRLRLRAEADADLAEQEALIRADAERHRPPAPPDEIQTTGQLEGLGKTYASLCAILRHDRRIFTHRLEWNEMLCCATKRGEELDETECGRVREHVELNCADSKNKPLKFSSTDVDQAIMQVSHEHKYHPVRDYLGPLK